MAVNGPRTTTSREDLAAAYHEFDPASSGYIAEMVLPKLPVNKRRGDYGVVPREAYLARIDTKRAPKAETSHSEWTPESAEWSMYEYAHKEFVETTQEEDYADRIDLQEVASTRLGRIIRTDMEIDAASLLFNETTFPVSGGSAKGATLNNTWASSSGTPIDDTQAGVEFIENNFGVDGLSLVMNKKVYRDLSVNDQVRAAITDTYGAVKPGLLPLDQLAIILGVKDILVAGAGTIYNSAKPGQAASITRIWSSTYAMLVKIETARDIQMPCIGRTFTLNDHSEGLAIDSWYQEDPEGNWIRAREHRKAILSPDPVGYLIKGVA